MKHLRPIYELFKTPTITQKDIEEMVDYIEKWVEENGYDIYRPKSMDIGVLMPDFPEQRFTKADPYGEEEWEVVKPKLMSDHMYVFPNKDPDAKRILMFHYVKKVDGSYYTEIYVDYTTFQNVGLDILKQIIEG